LLTERIVATVLEHGFSQVRLGRQGRMYLGMEVWAIVGRPVSGNQRLYLLTIEHDGHLMFTGQNRDRTGLVRAGAFSVRNVEGFALWAAMNIEFRRHCAAGPRSTQLASSHGEITEGDDMPMPDGAPSRNTINNKGANKKGGWSKGGGAGPKPFAGSAPTGPDPGGPDEYERPQRQAAPLCARVAAKKPCRDKHCKYQHPDDHQLETILMNDVDIAADPLAPALVPVVVTVPVETDGVVSDTSCVLLNEGHGRLVIGRLTGATRVLGITPTAITYDKPANKVGGVSVLAHKASFEGHPDLWCLPPGVVLPWGKESRYGTSVLQSSGVSADAARLQPATVTTMSPWTVDVTPAFSIGKQVHRAREHWVLIPLLKMLTKKFKAATVTNGIIAQATTECWSTIVGSSSDWPCLARFVDDTVAYFYTTTLLATRGASVTKSGILVASTAQEFDSEDMLNLYVHKDIESTGGPWVEPAVGPSACEYELNPRSHFSLIRGCRWGFDPDNPPVDASEAQASNARRLAELGVPIWREGEPNMPLFNTFGTSKRNMGTWRLAKLESSGGSQRIVEESTEALYVGLKRQCAKRSDRRFGDDSTCEALLYGAQRNLDKIALDYHDYRVSTRRTQFALSHSNLRRWSESRLLALGPTASKRLRTLGETLPLDPSLAGDSDEERAAYFARQRQTVHFMLKFVKERMSRTVLQRILDGAHNVGLAMGRPFREMLFNFRTWKYASLTHRESLLNTSDKRYEWAAIPNPKSAERMRMYQGMLMPDQSGTLVERGYIKIKKEGAKCVGDTMKPPRLFTPYKEGAIAAPWLAAQAKATLEGVHQLQIGRISVHIYCALHPDPEIKKDVFEFADRARASENTLFAALHSDDGLISGNVDGRPFTFNSDVTSCDGSHYEFPFLLLHTGYSQIDVDGADALIRQAALPFKAENPANPAESFFLSPHGKNRPFLGSGSANTTILNTLSMFTNVVHMARCLDEQQVTDDTDLPSVLALACAEMGYSVRFNSCERGGEYIPELKEFLKSFHDPDNNCAVLMPSAYLRNMFSRTGPITASSFGYSPTEYAIALRRPELLMHRVGSQVVAGLKNEPAHAWLHELRERFDDPVAPAIDRNEQRDFLAREAAPLSECALDCTAAVKRRYRLSDAEVDSLAVVLRTLQPGCRIVEEAYTKMLAMDYGIDRGYPVPLFARATALREIKGGMMDSMWDRREPTAILASQ
jgi:hypothetical protein